MLYTTRERGRETCNARIDRERGRVTVNYRERDGPTEQKENAQQKLNIITHVAIINKCPLKKMRLLSFWMSS